MATSLTWKDVSGVSATDAASALTAASTALKNATGNFTDGVKAMDEEANQQVNREVLNRMLAYQGQGADAYSRAVASGALTQGLDPSRINTTTYENLRGYGTVLDNAAKTRSETQDYLDSNEALRTNQGAFNSYLAAAHSGNPVAMGQAIEGLGNLPVPTRLLNNMLDKGGTGYSQALTNADSTFNFDGKVLNRARTDRLVELAPTLSKIRTSDELEKFITTLEASGEDPYTVSAVTKQMLSQGFKLNRGLDPIEEQLNADDAKRKLTQTPYTPPGQPAAGAGTTSPQNPTNVVAATRTTPAQGNLDDLVGVEWANKSGMRDSESSNKAGAVFRNPNGQSYGSKDQIGDDRLKDAFRAGILPKAMTGEEYSKLPEEVQEKVADWHYRDLDKQIKGSDLVNYIGQTVGGVPVTLSSLRAMAHIGGVNGTKKFLESGGKYDPADALKTKISDYGKKFAGSGATAGGNVGGVPITPTALVAGFPAPVSTNAELVDGFRPTTSSDVAQLPAAPEKTVPLNQQEQDRQALSKVWDTVKRANQFAGSAILDSAMLLPRGVVGAYDSTVVRGMRAAGLDANYVSPLLTPEGADVNSPTPHTDKLFAQYARENPPTLTPQTTAKTNGENAAPSAPTGSLGSSSNPLTMDKLSKLDNSSFRKVLDAGQTLAMDDHTRASINAARAASENLLLRLTPEVIASHKTADEIYEKSEWKNRVSRDWFTDSINEITSLADNQINAETAAHILEMSSEAAGRFSLSRYFNSSKPGNLEKGAPDPGNRKINKVQARALVSVARDTNALAAGQTKQQMAQKTQDGSASLVKQFEEYRAMLASVNPSNPRAAEQAARIRQNLQMLIESMPTQMRDEYRRKL